MIGPSGKSEFCFPSTLSVPRGEAELKYRGERGNKTHSFPWGHVDLLDMR